MDSSLSSTSGKEGYNIYEITRNFWVFEEIAGESFTGSLQEVILFAIFRYDFKIEELEMAIESMANRNNNAAHFGMWASFIYSFNKQFQKKMVS